MCTHLDCSANRYQQISGSNRDQLPYFNVKRIIAVTNFERGINLVGKLEVFTKSRMFFLKTSRISEWFRDSGENYLKPLAVSNSSREKKWS